MNAAVQFAIDRILEAEGGIKDVGDGKGLTRFGQTPGWLEDNGFVPPSNAGDASVNYETWMTRTGLADICILDPFVGWLVTDFAIHSGLHRAITTLQQALEVRADGVMGPKSMAALRAVAKQPNLSRRFVATRMRYNGRLISNQLEELRRRGQLRSATLTYGEYAEGWADRLADQVEVLP